MNYEERVRELEAEGMTTSDAQAVADVEWKKEKDFSPVHDSIIVSGCLRKAKYKK